MLQGVCVILFPWLALIKVRLYPGMHDQLAYGEGIKDLQEIVEFVRIKIAEPCLY